jgi:hypothetical protein
LKYTRNSCEFTKILINLFVNNLINISIVDMLQYKIELKKQLFNHLNGFFPNIIIPIIFSYCTQYYDQTNKTFKDSAINTIIGLTKNRLAMGSNNGFLRIYNLDDGTEIVKEIDVDPITAMCQIDDVTVACGIKNKDYIIVFDFENDIKKKIEFNNYGCDNIMLLSENIIGFITKSCFYILNFKTNIVLYQASPLTCVLKINDKILMSVEEEPVGQIRPRYISVSDYAKIFITQNDVNNIFLEESQYQKIKQMIHIENDIIAIVCNEPYRNKMDVIVKNDYIRIINIVTNQRIDIIYTIKGKIYNIIYLGNNNIAVLVDTVLIFNIITGEQIQTFKNKYLYITVVGDSIVTVDYKFNVNVHEKLIYID